jgi:hypothetical protein
VIFEEETDSISTEALIDAGFFNYNNLWIKINNNFCRTPSEVVIWLDKLSDVQPEARNHIRFLTTSLLEGLRRKTAVTAEIERLLWPGKIIDAEIPVFIVPIKPQWAIHLFDSSLAECDLFGADEQLALKTENVYYRSALPAGPTAPAYILWYVSKGRRGNLGTMSIRACSWLDEVIIGKPKELFRRFRRLGVYQWTNISNLVQGDLKRDIMALRFGRTELFEDPVSWDDLQEILSKCEGTGNPIASPVRICRETFLEIYKKGGSLTR